MRKTVVLLSTLATLAVPFGASGQAVAGEDQVRNVIRALFAAVERGDTAALDTLYAADVTVVEGTGINRGWTPYRAHHLLPELQQFRNFQYRPSEIEAHARGDLGWAIFRYSIRAEVTSRATPRLRVWRPNFMAHNIRHGTPRRQPEQQNGAALRLPGRVALG